ncbi:hypothetical protein ES332_A02G118100v1 [Gossypium tomentosum]|uniref:Uncharacterized protein n=1 Tax=Gossypium tomentosum TaxID=34277 RepID=A0A5D2RG30_GOSTO|nr:hypothetical protein ES332_A02G118100v1 [Gossypium tomentosum]
MVVVMKASMMAMTVLALTALMALIRGAGQTLPEASRIPYGARKKKLGRNPRVRCVFGAHWAMTVLVY